MAKKKVGGNNKIGDTTSEKGKKKKNSEQSHSEDKVTKSEVGMKGKLAKCSKAGNAAESKKKIKSILADEGSVVTRRYSTTRGGTVDEKSKGETSGRTVEDGMKVNLAKSKTGNAAKSEKTKSNLADEGSVVTRRYSTRRGGTVDENAKGETSGAMKIGKSASKGKRKLDFNDSHMVQTPAKNRKVGQKEVEAFASSNGKSSYSFRKNRAIPRFRKVDLSESEFRRVVGKRVRVALSESKRLCTGRIESYNRSKKQHRVVYDDGKSGELDMKTDQFELEINPGEAEAYNFKEGSSAGKGKPVSVEDDDTKEKQSKLKKEIASSVSEGRFTRAQKGKGIATETNKAKERDVGPVEKIIKLGEPVRTAEDRGSKSQKKGTAKKAGDEANVESKRFTRTQKRISTATVTSKAKERDAAPVEKIIKLGEPVRAAEDRGPKSRKKETANDEKTEQVASHKTVSDTGSDAKIVLCKTKKAGGEANVESRRNPVRKTRRN